MTTALMLYTRRGCHLCEVMAGALEPLLKGAGAELEHADIDADPMLRERFGWRVPVLAIGDDVICEGRLDEDAVRDALGLPAA